MDSLNLMKKNHIKDNSNYYTKNIKGFSLIEGSMVMIIVSALVVVIIGARSLMESAKVSVVISEIEVLKSAEAEFKNKYKFKPGDVPAATAALQFSVNANASTCDSASLGNNYWDNICEEDTVWLQLSDASFIKEKINFDVVSAPTYRDPIAHRPASELSPQAGYTFFQTSSYDQLNSTLTYNGVLRFGAKEDDQDVSFSKGVLTGEQARNIDAKIDAADTPYTGKFVVKKDCDYNLTGSYSEVPVNCVGSVVDQNLGDM